MTAADMDRMRRFTRAARTALGPKDGYFGEVDTDAELRVTIGTSGLTGSFSGREWKAATLDELMGTAEAWLRTKAAKRVRLHREQLDEELRRQREAEAILAGHDPEPNPRQK
jgi:hypothetical protein